MGLRVMQYWTLLLKNSNNIGISHPIVSVPEYKTTADYVKSYIATGKTELRDFFELLLTKYRQKINAEKEELFLQHQQLQENINSARIYYDQVNNIIKNENINISYDYDKKTIVISNDEEEIYSIKVKNIFDIFHTLKIALNYQNGIFNQLNNKLRKYDEKLAKSKAENRPVFITNTDDISNAIVARRKSAQIIEVIEHLLSINNDAKKILSQMVKSTGNLDRAIFEYKNKSTMIDRRYKTLDRLYNQEILPGLVEKVLKEMINNQEITKEELERILELLKEIDKEGDEGKYQYIPREDTQLTRISHWFVNEFYYRPGKYLNMASQRQNALIKKK